MTKSPKNIRSAAMSAAHMLGKDTELSWGECQAAAWAVVKAARQLEANTGLSWETCLLAAAESWRTKKFEELRAAREACNPNNGAFFDFNISDPYRLADAKRRDEAAAAWWTVFNAMTAGQQKAA